MNFKEVIKIPKRRSKFNVDLSAKGKLRRTYEGILYDSELEMRYFKEVIQVGLKDGTIKEYKRQVKYELQPKCKYQGENILAINYVADFVITYIDGSVVVWDVKGRADATAKLKKKMFHYKYPEIDYRWAGYSAMDGGWLEYKLIEQARKLQKKEKNRNK